MGFFINEYQENGSRRLGEQTNNKEFQHYGWHSSTVSCFVRASFGDQQEQ
jgi:hypothetical protein